MPTYLRECFDELCEFPLLMTWRALAMLILAGYAVGGGIIGFVYLSIVALDGARSLVTF